MKTLLSLALLVAVTAHARVGERSSDFKARMLSANWAPPGFLDDGPIDVSRYDQRSAMDIFALVKGEVRVDVISVKGIISREKYSHITQSEAEEIMKKQPGKWTQEKVDKGLVWKGEAGRKAAFDGAALLIDDGVAQAIFDKQKPKPVAPTASRLDGI